MCGEQKSRLVTSRVVEGSSPRVRGTGQSLTSKYSKAGIIPACAGNSRHFRRTLLSCRDHPRVCGEQTSSVARAALTKGSSPRVRGTVAHVTSRCKQVRIIPACAGNRTSESFLAAVLWDHPRVCGEQEPQPGIHPSKRGSSPRVRGTVQVSQL